MTDCIYIGEEDIFVFNDKFTSKLTRIKIGTVAAQKETEPEKVEEKKKKKRKKKKEKMLYD